MTTSILTAVFWRAALERAVKAFAASLAAVLTAGGAGILDATFVDALSTAGMAALVSLLLSVASDAATGGSGPSLTNAETTAPADPPALRRPRSHRGAVDPGYALVLVVVVLLIIVLLRATHLI